MGPSNDHCRRFSSAMMLLNIHFFRDYYPSRSLEVQSPCLLGRPTVGRIAEKDRTYYFITPPFSVFFYFIPPPPFFSENIRQRFSLDRKWSAVLQRCTNAVVSGPPCPNGVASGPPRAPMSWSAVQIIRETNAKPGQ